MLKDYEDCNREKLQVTKSSKIKPFPVADTQSALLEVEALARKELCDSAINEKLIQISKAYGISRYDLKQHYDLKIKELEHSEGII